MLTTAPPTAHQSNSSGLLMTPPWFVLSPTEMRLHIERRSVSHLVSWCDDHNLELNTAKRWEMIIDFRRKSTSLPLSPPDNS
ncbi:hypothetical protein LDENG_00123090 [Lucifuga dentata]|nr:hypothetical protein LDENG_00123090 [Lucifuga dentata]